jgi:ATP-dependent helicase/DNAse subunit B
MRHVLAIREPERPEERIRVSALDRGSLIHESADRFFQEFLE